jgi:lipopolysaccharide biosynthesis glycosyltransferase
MKKDLLVTLADWQYLNQTKQLFSSVFYNAKWKGDCMLIYQDISPQKLLWFKERGILTKKCSPLYPKKIDRYPPILTTKLHIYDISMKQWNKIIYLDGDVTVRDSLEDMLAIDRFTAMPENGDQTLAKQFVDYPKTPSKFIKKTILKINYDLTTPAFNAGIIVFPTNIITKQTIKKFKRLLTLYGEISLFGDQGVHNLFFYQNWSKLSSKYNYFPLYSKDNLRIPFSKIDASIIHFADMGKINKPWHPDNYFYKEWKNNLEKSDNIYFDS